MNKAARFFIFCSGTDQSILEQCPTDRNKYMGIGATIFFTGVLAFFSAGYALYTVFDSWLSAITFGLVWGLMIFNLDRYIVMSMKNNGKWYKDLLIALPRIGLATLLALVISKPLEMKIFEKEINSEIVLMEQEKYKSQEDGVRTRFDNQITTYISEIAQLKQEIADKTAARDTLVVRAIQEADGTGGSGHRNLGPIYKTKKAEADNAATELQQILALNLPAIAEKEQAIKTLNTTVQTEISSLERSRFNGLAARMEALSRLSASSEAILLAVWFITFLFVAIEIAPVLVKLISYRSPYDYLLHNHEHVYEMTHKEQVTQRQNAILNKLKADTEIGVYRVNAEIQAEKAAIDQALKEKLEGLNWNKGKWSGA